jgi:hypothetical protein
MSKVLLVLDINDESGIELEGLKFAIEQAFSPEDLKVDDAYLYPFEGSFRADYISVLQDTHVVLTGNYDREFTEEEIVQVASIVADRISEGIVAEETNNAIAEVVEELFGQENEKEE